ncbi:MAG: DUF3592 domain-containing protein [Candidatus Sedimenticola sp. (ex Thyasira tokunagai)]
MTRLDSIAYILLVLTGVCVFQAADLTSSYWSVNKWVRTDAQPVWVKGEYLGDAGPVGKMPALQVNTSKVQYSYWVNGTEHHGVVQKSDRYSLNIGRSFDVFYNPKNPSFSTTTRTKPWGNIGMWIVFSFVSLGVLYGWMRLKVRYEQP